MRSLLIKLLFLLVVLTSAFVLWVYSSTYHPDEIQPAPLHSPADLPTLQPGQKLKVLSWNIQFMAGNTQNHFFYDGGDDPWPSKQKVMQTANAMIALLKAQNADLVLLQEVDEQADRTALVDQQQLLLDALPEYQVYSATYYWKADYVPHPSVAGKVATKLLVLSKYPIEQATRYALPAITSDDFITRQFNLKRAMLEVSLPIAGGNTLQVVNTHLSAFAQGSNTMQLQVARVNEQIQQYQQQGQPWLIAGDFNLLPNKQSFMALPVAHQASYNAHLSEISPLLKTYSAIPSAEAAASQQAQDWFTYMPPEHYAQWPDRTIDYIFYSSQLGVTAAQVLKGDALMLSDHLPLMMEFTLPKR